MATTRETHVSPEEFGETRKSRGSRASRSSQQQPIEQKDRFDDLPKSGRVGAHRIVGSPRRFWIYLVSAVVGVALLTAAGIIAIQVSGASSNSGTEQTDTQSAEPKVKPELDPEAPVVVLNGTSMPGFGAIVDGIITDNGWGKILFSGEAAANDVAISAVFYSSVADESAALALANELGGVSIFQSYDYTQYGAKLVVLLGADYGGPGSEQFVPVEAEADES